MSQARAEGGPLKKTITLASAPRGTTLWTPPIKQEASRPTLAAASLERERDGPVNFSKDTSAAKILVEWRLESFRMNLWASAEEGHSRSKRRLSNHSPTSYINSPKRRAKSSCDEAIAQNEKALDEAPAGQDTLDFARLYIHFSR